MDLTWSAAAARPAVTMYLAQGIRVTSATVAGKAVEPASQPVAESRLVAWKLPAPVPAGETTVRLQVTASPGDASGGALLPGSGWFPRATVSGDELAAHTVSFKLPEGWSGIAAGVRGADGTWSAPTGRPYAVWGPYRNRTETAKGSLGGEQAFSVWSRSDAGALPVAMVAGLVHALGVGLGDAEGEGDWKIIQADRIAGGLRTLFWGGPAPSDARLRERDLAGALAAGFWTESVGFRGERAAFLSRAIPLQLGDIAESAASLEDDPTGLERRTIGQRRDQLVASIAKDRALHGLIDLSEAGDTVLPTRGALVAHVLAESWPTRTRWMVDLRAFREEMRGRTADWDAFAPRIFWKTKELVEPLLATTDLPDFRLLSHTVLDTKMGGRRYSVEVENRGKAAASAEVATFDGADQLIHTTRVFLDAGDKKVLKFADPEAVARIAVEPRGVMPQADLSGESAVVEPLEPRTPEELAARIPSFRFDQEPPAQKVRGLDLDLGEVIITGFEGWVVPFSTHHGPSGACLLGQAAVTIRPQGDGAAPFLEAMDIAEMKFPDARDLWIRFPLEAWDRIQAHPREAVAEQERYAVLNKQNWVYGFSFETYFIEGTEAQVPPPGSALVVFRTGAEEWKGYVREPLPDATVNRRLWNHLASTTLWEDRR
jgi:hypothetical protein